MLVWILACAVDLSDPPATAPEPQSAVEHATWMTEVSARIRDASRAFVPANGGYRAEITEHHLSVPSR